jgi:hypothetical protein
MLLYVHSLGQCRREMVFVDSDCKWVYLIFPALLAAARRGIEIHYLHSENDSPDAHEAYRRRILEGLGARVAPIPQLPFRGFVADFGTHSGVAVVASSPVSGDVYVHEQAKAYSANGDRVVLDKLYEHVRGHLRAGTKARALSYESCDTNRLFARLREVQHYSKAKFSVASIHIDARLYAVQTLVKEYKYLQADTLVEDFLSHQLDLFSPQQVLLEGFASIVTPPIVETIGDNLLVIDGHARALHSVRNRMGTFKAILVDGVDAPPRRDPSGFRISGWHRAA